MTLTRKPSNDSPQSDKGNESLLDKMMREKRRQRQESSASMLSQSEKNIDQALAAYSNFIENSRGFKGLNAISFWVKIAF